MTKNDKFIIHLYTIPHSFLYSHFAAHHFDFMDKLTFLLIIILVIVIALYVYKVYVDYGYLQYTIIPNLPKIQIASDAQSEFSQFMNNRPNLKEHEQRETRIPNIIAQPIEYFRYELLEPEHRYTAHIVGKNNWVMNIGAMKNWEIEELALQSRLPEFMNKVSPRRTNS